MSELKQLRIEKKMTQQQVADLVGISLRSYKSYENDLDKEDTFKYRYICEKLLEINPIDEDHGVVDIDYIKSKCGEIFKKYDIDFCYLFGSYAKSVAGPTSDIDLLVSSKTKGLQFYALVEDIRISLNKRVDVLNIDQLRDNYELTREILQDGIKIYG